MTRKAGKYRPFLTIEQRADIVRRYVAGEPLAAIAARHDVTVPAAIHHAEAAGVPMRGKTWRARTRARTPETGAA